MSASCMLHALLRTHAHTRESSCSSWNKADEAARKGKRMITSTTNAYVTIAQYSSRIHIYIESYVSEFAQRPIVQGCVMHCMVVA